MIRAPHHGAPGGGCARTGRRQARAYQRRVPRSLSRQLPWPDGVTAISEPDGVRTYSIYDAPTMSGLVRIGRGSGEGTNPFPLSIYSAPGGLRQGPGGAAQLPAEARTCGNGSRELRVLLSTYGSRGDVEPLVGLVVQLKALGAEVRVCDALFDEALDTNRPSTRGRSRRTATSCTPARGWADLALRSRRP